MTKTKRIVCPHCRTAHKPGEGYSFDQDLSLICGKCSKVIFPANQNAEAGIPKVADRRYSGNNRGYHHQQDCEVDINFA